MVQLSTEMVTGIKLHMTVVIIKMGLVIPVCITATLLFPDQSYLKYLDVVLRCATGY